MPTMIALNRDLIPSITPGILKRPKTRNGCQVVAG
jgi:hypothetical protein